jgi:hypothetical protein
VVSAALTRLLREVHEQTSQTSGVWPELRSKNDVGDLRTEPLGLGYRKDLVQTPQAEGPLNARVRASSASQHQQLGRADVHHTHSQAVHRERKNIDGGIAKLRTSPVSSERLFGHMEILRPGRGLQISILDSPAASSSRSRCAVEFVPPIEGMFMFEQDTNAP